MNMRFDLTHEPSRASLSTQFTSVAPQSEVPSHLNNRTTYRSTVETTDFEEAIPKTERELTIEAPQSLPSRSVEPENKHRYHSTYDNEENFWNRMAGGLVLGLVATAVLFLALPFFQLISTVGTHDIGVVSIDMSKPPPPAPPVEQPPPPEKEDRTDKPELKNEMPKLTLSQLELALNPGMGDATAGGDFSLDFQVHAMEELEIIFELSEVDRIPQPIFRVAPLYPYEMKQKGINGYVSILFICDTQGRVKNVRVKSSSHREFEQEAVDALRQWKFEPGTKDGQPVNVRMLVPFKFNTIE
jgi:protein TonB